MIQPFEQQPQYVAPSWEQQPMQQQADTIESYEDSGDIIAADSQSAEDLDFISNAELQLVLMKHGFVHDEESGILVKELTKRELAVDALYRFLDRVTFGSVSRHFGL